jgi:phenylacetate-CoA ligase
MQTHLHNALLHAATPVRLRLFRLVQSRTGWLHDRIRSYQEERLRELIDYCWTHVPFYRSRWKQFISDPREIRTLPDLQRLPVLTKDELREELPSLTTTLRRLRGEPARSGGSTGRPTLFRMNRHDAEMAWAQMYLAWSWAGYRPGMPFLAVGGESLGIGLSDRRTWKDWMVNRWITSGSNVTVERVKALAASPSFERIEFVYGYPNAIRELGEFLHELGARPPRLKGVVCTAEVMLAEARERISQTLGSVPVHDQYGLNDGGLLAAEGPEQDGLHVFFHRAILEILDQRDAQIDTPGRPGRAVATSLTNRATPFVRYETGDEVHWKTFQTAASGIGWPRIGPVDGRIGDVIFLPSGRRIAMPGLTLVMRWMEGLSRYQFIQTGPRSVTARLERGPRFALSEQQVVVYLKARIAGEIDWTVQWDAPELTRGGKLLIIRNDWLRGQGLSRPPQPSAGVAPAASFD